MESLVEGEGIEIELIVVNEEELDVIELNKDLFVVEVNIIQKLKLSVKKKSGRVGGFKKKFRLCDVVE